MKKTTLDRIFAINSDEIRREIYSGIIPIIKDKEIWTELDSLLEKTYEFPLDDYPVVIELSKESRQMFKEKFKHMFGMLSRVDFKLKKPMIAGSAALNFLMEILEKNCPLTKEEKDDARVNLSMFFTGKTLFAPVPIVPFNPPAPGPYPKLIKDQGYYLKLVSKRIDNKSDVDIWDLGSDQRVISTIIQHGKSYDIVPIAEKSPLKVILDFDLPECRAAIPLSTDGTKILTTYQCLRSIFTEGACVPIFTKNSTAELKLLLEIPFGNPGIESELVSQNILSYEDENPTYEMNENLNILLSILNIYGVEFYKIFRAFFNNVYRTMQRKEKYHLRNFYHSSVLESKYFENGVPGYVNLRDECNNLITKKLLFDFKSMLVTEEVVIHEVAPVSNDPLTEIFEDAFDGQNIELLSPKEKLNVVFDYYVKNVETFNILKGGKFEDPFSINRRKPNGELIDFSNMKVCNKSQIYWFFHRCITDTYYDDRSRNFSCDTYMYRGENQKRRQEIVRRALVQLEAYKTHPEVVAHNRLLANAGFYVNEDIYKLIEDMFLYE